MRMYIKGIGIISPQQTWDGSFLSQPLNYTGNKLACVEPDHEKYVDPKAIRRMSRIIKMGVSASAIALKEAGVSMPDAIITATGYGCLEDTGIFLSKMIGNREEALNPTPFIQSTHNTIGSQIALLLQCQAYNQTYTHGAFSFESALMDAMLQLSESPSNSILVGGIDEITAISHKIQSRFGIFRKSGSSSLDLFKSRDKGTLNGEGSSFFVFTGEKTKDVSSCVRSLTTIYKPERQDLETSLAKVLTKEGLKSSDIDLIISGKCGDPSFDQQMENFISDVFPVSSTAVFKHLCGEYPIASGFALWLGSMILKHQQIPNIVLEKDKGRPLKNVLIYNQYFGTHHSFILLTAC